MKVGEFNAARVLAGGPGQGPGKTQATLFPDPVSSIL